MRNTSPWGPRADTRRAVGKISPDFGSPREPLSTSPCSDLPRRRAWRAPLRTKEVTSHPNHSQDETSDKLVHTGTHPRHRPRNTHMPSTYWNTVAHISTDSLTAPQVIRAYVGCSSFKTHKDTHTHPASATSTQHSRFTPSLHTHLHTPKRSHILLQHAGSWKWEWEDLSIPQE